MFLLEERELYRKFIDFENILFKTNRIKIERNLTWRRKHLKNVPGIYAIFDNNNLVYIGETGDILKRMADITRTVNHTFRKQIGANKFNGIKSSKKFDADIEELIDKYFDTNLYLTFIEVNYGRLELEIYLVDKYQDQILNSVKKRKIFNYILLKEMESSIN